MDVIIDDPLAGVKAWDAEADRIETPCGGGSMAWRSWGRGRTLVLLHGGAGSWRHWIRTIPVLAERYRVLAPDLPGLGDSAVPGVPWSPHASAAITARGLATVLSPAEAFDIVGFSAGSMLAGLVAQELEDRCGTLILVGGGSLGTARAPVVLEKVRNKTGEERRQAHCRNLATLMIADPSNIDERAIAIQAWNSDQARVSSVGFADKAVLHDALAASRTPAKAIWGAEDAVARGTLAERCAILRRLRPDAEIRIIPGAGHWVAYEAADAFNDSLVVMLDGDLHGLAGARQ